MIIRYLECIEQGELNVNWGKGTSRRLITSKDGFPFSFSDTLVNPGSDYEIQYPNHLEVCYILEGSGKLFFGSESIELKPGVLYGLNDHDFHRIIAYTQIRMICVFTPALYGHEKHDFSSGISSY